MMTSFLLLPPAEPPQVASIKIPRASSETRLTEKGPHQRHKRRSSSSSATSSSHCDDVGLVSQLKRLKVSSLTESQKRKQKQLKHREFRNKIKQVILQRRGSVRTSNLDKNLKSNQVVLKSSRLSQVVSSLSEHKQRHRHASDSSPVLNSGQLFPSISTKSLQDFSKCCKKLETFSIGDLASVDREEQNQASFRDTQFQQFQNVDDGDEEDDEYDFPGSKGHHECDNLDHKCIKKSSSSSCAQQARNEYNNDVSVNDLAGYLEDSIVFPKKMSYMAEMMYT